VRISYGPDSTADALLHEFTAARRFAWRQSQCCTLFKRAHYPALTSIERERLSRKNLHMAAKDWLPDTVQAAGANRKLKAGQALFRRGGRTVGLYEILSGHVRLARIDRAGREAILYVAGASDTIAEASLFSPTYQCDATATTASTVRLYPKAVLLAEFERNPAAAQAFMAMLGHQVMHLRTRLEQRSIRSARDRVRHYLVANSNADGQTVVLPGTLKELAGELGLTHEALYRTLSEMTVDGEIERLRGRIRLLGVRSV
jgi:CRP-like cAMP-binding protein